MYTIMLPRSGVRGYWHFIIRHRPIATPGASLSAKTQLDHHKSEPRISEKLFQIEVEIKVQLWIMLTISPVSA